MLNGINGVIIDLDGTMAHTAPDFQIAINHMRAGLDYMRAGLDLPALSIDKIERFVGKGTDHLVRSCLAVDLPASEVERLFAQALEAYHQHYLQINGDHAVLYAGVKEGLEAMRAKHLRLACVTNKPIAFAVPLLHKMGLHSYFEIVYGGDSFARKKPDPYPLLQACNYFGLHPAQVVAIGDSSNDTQAARAAGCRVLTVPYGYNHGLPIQEADSDGIVESLLEAAQLISP